MSLSQVLHLPEYSSGIEIVKEELAQHFEGKGEMEMLLSEGHCG